MQQQQYTDGRPHINQQYLEMNLLKRQAPVNSKFKIFLSCAIISLTSMNLGFSLTVISASNLTKVKNYYDVDLSNNWLLSILNGMMPVGGIIGSFMIPLLLRYPNKKRIHIFLTISTAVIGGIMLIPFFPALVAGRVLLGANISFYMSLAATYIKQISPFYLRKPLAGLFNSCRIFGFLSCYTFAYHAIQVDSNDLYFLLLFFGSAVICLIQAIFMHFFVPSSPYDLVRSKKIIEAKAVLKVLYKQNYIQQKLEWIQYKIQRTNYTHSLLNCPPYRFYYMCALHVALLRQFCGETFIILHIKLIFTELNSADIYENAFLLITGVDFLASIAGVFLILASKRKHFVLIGSVCLLVINIILAVTDKEQKTYLTLSFMVIFMIFCGCLITPVVWFYPAQMAKIQQVRNISITNWIGGFVIAFFSPFVMGYVNNGYPVFFFLAFYLILGTALSKTYLAEPEMQSLNEFKRRANFVELGDTFNTK